MSYSRYEPILSETIIVAPLSRSLYLPPSYATFIGSTESNVHVCDNEFLWQATTWPTFLVGFARVKMQALHYRKLVVMDNGVLLRQYFFLPCALTPIGVVWYERLKICVEYIPKSTSPNLL